MSSPIIRKSVKSIIKKKSSPAPVPVPEYMTIQQIQFDEKRDYVKANVIEMFKIFVHFFNHTDIMPEKTEINSLMTKYYNIDNYHLQSVRFRNDLIKMIIPAIVNHKRINPAVSPSSSHCIYQFVSRVMSNYLKYIKNQGQDNMTDSYMISEYAHLVHGVIAYYADHEWFDASRVDERTFDELCEYRSIWNS